MVDLSVIVKYKFIKWMILDYVIFGDFFVLLFNFCNGCSVWFFVMEDMVIIEY